MASPKILRRDMPSLLAKAETASHLIESLYAARGFRPPDDSCYSLRHLAAPHTLRGLDAALALLTQAWQQQSRILIVGDFDADGATSTALACRCLSAFGFAHVDFLVPNRFDFGYGLTPEIVELAGERQPDMIVTVDNGIASVEGVAAAKARGMTVIVTDHHLPGSVLPDADAIVNPNQTGCEFMYKGLAGVGVIFYLMSALRGELRDSGAFDAGAIQEPKLAQFLDLVALGTVADLVPLEYNNRILVEQGLQRIRSGLCCAGIRALAEVGGRELSTMSTGDFGFVLGPRLNAAGRLDDMSIGIRLLMTDDEQEARRIAKELDDLNRDRRSIEAGMKKEALALLDAMALHSLDNDKLGICLYQEDWHQGVIGILASRVKEQVFRPTIVFAKTEKGDLKGSGRSVPGVHLRDVLDDVATEHPGLLKKFGGHAMAAGLSLEEHQLQQFEQAFDRAIRQRLLREQGVASLNQEIITDGELQERQLTLDIAQAIRHAGPWGQAFPEPQFDGVFRVLQQRLVREKHLKLLLAAEEYSDKVIDAIAFNIDPQLWPNNHVHYVHIVYSLDINRYRGRESLQLIIRHIEETAAF